MHWYINFYLVSFFRQPHNIMLTVMKKGVFPLVFGHFTFLPSKRNFQIFIDVLTSSSFLFQFLPSSYPVPSLKMTEIASLSKLANMFFAVQNQNKLVHPSSRKKWNTVFPVIVAAATINFFSKWISVNLHSLLPISAHTILTVRL